MTSEIFCAHYLLRATPDQMDRWECEAKRSGLDLSKWIRRVLDEECSTRSAIREIADE